MLLEACSKVNLLLEANQIHQQMRDQDMHISSVAYSYFMECKVRCGRMQEAW